MQKLPEDAAFDNVRFAGYIKKDISVWAEM